MTLIMGNIVNGVSLVIYWAHNIKYFSIRVDEQVMLMDLQ